MKKLSPLEKSEKYGEELMYEFARWNELNTGKQKIVDPFCADGDNMNLCREHILYCRLKVEEELPENLYPEAYFWKVPDKVSNNYIANKESIAAQARKRIEEVKQMPGYQKLIQLKPQYELVSNPKSDSHFGVFFYTVISYVHNFADAIEKVAESMKNPCPGNEWKDTENILTMRRYTYYSDSWWQSAFSDCLRRLCGHFPQFFTPDELITYQFTVEGRSNSQNSGHQTVQPSSIMVSTKKSGNSEFHQFNLFEFGL